MSRLKDKIEEERYLHRKLIDEIVEKHEVCECTILPAKPPVDLMTIDLGTHL